MTDDLLVVRADEALSDDALREFIWLGIDSFRCSLSSYHEAFLKENAVEHAQHNTSKTYLVIDAFQLKRLLTNEDTDAFKLILGYFTIGLSSFSLAESGLSGKQAKRLKSHTFVRRSMFGCYVLGELCRGDACDRISISGEQLLEMALAIVQQAQELIGGRVLLVDSRRKLFDELYKPAGFSLLELAENKTEDGEDLFTSFLILK